MQADQQLVDNAETMGIDTLRAVTDAVSEILTAPPRRAAAVTYLRQRGIDTDRSRTSHSGTHRLAGLAWSTTSAALSRTQRCSRPGWLGEAARGI